MEAFPGAAAAAFAQEAGEIPVPSLRTELEQLPGVAQLPERPKMPDVMAMNHGARVATRVRWAHRRDEMKTILAHHAVGRMPPVPGKVTGREVQSAAVLDGRVRYRLVELTFASGRALSLRMRVLMVAGAFDERLMATPVVWWDRTPNPPAATAGEMTSRFSDVYRRGYALAVFNPNDCAQDFTLRNADGSLAFRTTRFYPAYPGYDWGILAGWAWGASRVAGYLETDPAIDKRKLIVAGASRMGKSSMVAATFDERLMQAPVMTGGGGVGAYRFAGPRGSETLDIMLKKYPT